MQANLHLGRQFVLYRDDAPVGLQGFRLKLFKVPKVAGSGLQGHGRVLGEGLDEGRDCAKLRAKRSQGVGL